MTQNYLTVNIKEGGHTWRPPIDHTGKILEAVRIQTLPLETGHQSSFIIPKHETILYLLPYRRIDTIALWKTAITPS